MLFQKSSPKRFMVLAFLFGALIPLFWGIAGMVLFNVPEGSFSRVFWNLVYLTCPFWRIEGKKALFLMPLLNGATYALLAFTALRVFRGPDDPRQEAP
jgi:hypothetical protein